MGQFVPHNLEEDNNLLGIHVFRLATAQKSYAFFKHLEGKWQGWAGTHPIFQNTGMDIFSMTCPSQIFVKRVPGTGRAFFQLKLCLSMVNGVASQLGINLSDFTQLLFVH